MSTVQPGKNSNLMSSHHIAVHITFLHPYLKCFAYLNCFTCAVRVSVEAVGAVVRVVAVQGVSKVRSDLFSSNASLFI